MVSVKDPQLSFPLLPPSLFLVCGVWHHLLELGSDPRGTDLSLPFFQPEIFFWQTYAWLNFTSFIALICHHFIGGNIPNLTFYLLILLGFIIGLIAT